MSKDTYWEKQFKCEISYLPILQSSYNENFAYFSWSFKDMYCSYIWGIEFICCPCPYMYLLPGLHIQHFVFILVSKKLPTFKIFSCNFTLLYIYYWELFNDICQHILILTVMLNSLFLSKINAQYFNKLYKLMQIKYIQT